MRKSVSTAVLQNTNHLILMQKPFTEKAFLFFENAVSPFGKFIFATSIRSVLWLSGVCFPLTEDQDVLTHLQIISRISCWISIAGYSLLQC